MKIPYQLIDRSWTLFLDRDGVINIEKHLEYIHYWEEFRFYEGVPDAIRIFSEIFGRIVVVTNQKGVGKGLTTRENLDIIHENMTAELNRHGGRIDGVFYCPDLDDNSPCRKPNPGMGHQAADRFPDINFKKSIMVGNNLSDMQFGRNLGIYTVFLTTTKPDINLNDTLIDTHYPSLIAFARHLSESQKENK